MTDNTNHTEQKKWDYNPVGNHNDRVCRKLLAEELLSPSIIHVIDVGEDSMFQRNVDIDLLIVNPAYQISTLEVKADNYGKSGDGVKRIFLEYISNDNKFVRTAGTEGKGCVLISKSEFFLYYFIKLGSYLVMDTKRLQKWMEVNVNTGKYTVKSAKTYGYNQEVLYQSYGILVPVQVLIDEIGARLFTSHLDFYEFEKHIA